MPMRVSISLAKPLYHLVSGALTISSGGVLWTQLENQVKTTHDLEMEHWNAAFKVHVATAGGNVNASTITRTGMVLSTLWQVCSSFDSATNIRPLTSRHYKKKDEDMVVDALHRKYNVFEAEGTHVKFQFHEITSTKLTESLLNGSKGTSRSAK